MTDNRRTNAIAYRADIDGLRAVAIVPVVLYHAEIAPFGGGYVGVDIFFVISGYLITSFILGQIQRGEFTLLNFYLRRIRRIFPALFLMMAFCAAIGWLCLRRMTTDGLAKAYSRPCFFARTSCSGSSPAISPRSRKHDHFCTPGRWEWKSSFTSCSRFCWSCLADIFRVG